MKTIIIAVLLLLTACNENEGSVVGEVHGTYVVCVDPASAPFQVGIKSGTKVNVGDPCPAGERR